jgi:23S rRNA (guanosine2251-2'-O)-methyltransferase
MGVERLYGWHTVRALLSQAPQRVLRIYLQQGRADPRADELEVQARSAGKAIQRVDGGRLRGWVGEVAHQGVVAEVSPLAPLSEDDFYQQLGTALNPLVLALDGVQDPHNLGACLRTANACGVMAVVVPRDRAATLNAAAKKVAAGAAESTPVVTVTNLARTLKLIKDAGLWIVGADAGAPQPAAAIDLTGARCLVMGSEGTGLRELTRRNCDWLVNLPSLGTVESLNVSVAAGMLLYEAVRQRQPASKPS